MFSGGDGRVVQIAESDFAGVLGLGELSLDLLRGQAGLLGDGGGVAFFAERVLARNLGLLQFGLNLCAGRALVGFGGLRAGSQDGHGQHQCGSKGFHSRPPVSCELGIRTSGLIAGGSLAVSR
ncbi:hypothetical protein D3C81_1733170 [compost metagenome]